jgi:hypothetical protein
MKEVALDVMNCSSSMNLDADWMVNSIYLQMSETYFLAEKTHKREGVVQLSGSIVETDVMAGWN